MFAPAEGRSSRRGGLGFDQLVAGQREETDQVRMRRAGQRRPGSDSDERSELVEVLVAAECATNTDTGPPALARAARVITGAETVWLRTSTESEVVRAGRRNRSEHVLPLLATAAMTGTSATSEPGLKAAPLSGGAAILFAFSPPDPHGPADPDASTRHARLVAAVSRWVDLRLGQRSLAVESERAAQAELRALRAQISPHFVFNAMGAIAALMRIDPEQAHGLLLDFADYTRYSFGRHGEYTTLAEELRSIEIYLSLERARFGDRLSVRVTIPPEVLTMAIPFLVLQPLVENAIRHGIEPLPLGGRVSVTAEDDEPDVRIEVEDDGAGADPAVIEGLLGPVTELGGVTPSIHVGLRNIDERLRAVYGDAHGLVIETAPGAGTKVTLTIPKYRPDVMV